MPTPKPKGIIWLGDVAKHDYQAAASYLSLLYRDEEVSSAIAKFRKARVGQFKAKDIFRAARLPLLGVGNSHVEKDRVKIRRGQGLSPILMVRDEAVGRVQIADGYHRLCAVYEFDEDTPIPCKII
jgi:hypothetical protein